MDKETSIFESAFEVIPCERGSFALRETSAASRGYIGKTWAFTSLRDLLSFFNSQQTAKAPSDVVAPYADPLPLQSAGITVDPNTFCRNAVADDHDVKYRI